MYRGISPLYFERNAILKWINENSNSTPPGWPPNITYKVQRPSIALNIQKIIDDKLKSWQIFFEEELNLLEKKEANRISLS